MEYTKTSNDTALINVDMTKDFLPGGTLEHPEGLEIIPTINWLRQQFQKVVWTKEIHDAHHNLFASSHPGTVAMQDTLKTAYGDQWLWPDHCVDGTEGTEFHEDLDIRDEDMVVVKGTDPQIHAFSAFLMDDRETEIVYPDGKTMQQKLEDEGIKRVFVTGLLHDFCAGLTAVDAAKAGFEVYFVEDASKALELPTGEGDQTSLDVVEELFEKYGVKKVNAEDVPALIGTVAPPAPKVQKPRL